MATGHEHEWRFHDTVRRFYCACGAWGWRGARGGSIVPYRDAAWADYTAQTADAAPVSAQPTYPQERWAAAQAVLEAE